MADSNMRYFVGTLSYALYENEHHRELISFEVMFDHYPSLAEIRDDVLGSYRQADRRSGQILYMQELSEADYRSATA